MKVEVEVEKELPATDQLEDKSCANILRLSNDLQLAKLPTKESKLRVAHELARKFY